MSDNEQKRVFSINLGRLLNEHHKSQKEVADAIGVSPQTFNTWIQGIAIPRMDKIQLLANYFGIKKSALIDPMNEDGDVVRTLTPEETAIALAYRKADEGRKDSVAVLLGVERKESTNSRIKNIG